MGSSNGFAVRLFGRAEFDRAVEPPGGPARRLLARLILASRPLGRAEIAQTLWPEAEPERGRFYLRRALSGLRPCLWEGVELLAEGDALRLAIGPRTVDVLAFDDLLREGDLTTAVELHAAPLLAEWPDAWLVPERESRRLAWHGAIETLAHRDLTEGRPAEAARRLAVAVAADPLRESSQRLLIESLRICGDGAQAERSYERFEKALRAELGVSPSAETREAARRRAPVPIVKRIVAEGPERALPVALTTLIGREGARAAVLDALSAQRLVTLVGAGGIGKTRLALACAESLSTEHVDLVAMVDLASQEDGRSLWSLLARSVRAPSGSHEEGVVQHLQGRRTILVLDNCEHLIDAAGELARTLLDRLPDVRVLATSREALGLPDEAVFDVPPLDLPSAEALFRESAARKGKRIPDSADAARIVRSVCESLDGLPLALNLAAGALRMATLQELAEDTHGILGADASKSRHRSLRATTEWSYRLLSAAEGRVLKCVAVVRGAWTLEFAAATAGMEPEAVRDSLRGLVAKSLVGMEEDEWGPRYRLLETIREDALRRLAEGGEEEAARRRLRDAVVASSRSVWDQFRHEPRPAAIRQIDVVESVLQDCLRSGEGRTAGVDILAHVIRLFDYTNRYREAASYFERFLADAPGIDPMLRVNALTTLVLMRSNWGDGLQVLTTAEEAVEAARRTEDPHCLANALSSQGIALYSVGRYREARTSLETSLPLWKHVGLWDSFGHNSIWAGKAALALDDLAAAAGHFDQAAYHIERLAGPHSVAVLILNRARLAFRRGDLARAVRLFADAERRFVEVGDRVHEAAAKVGGAVCLARMGSASQAAEMLAEAEQDARPLVGSVDALYDGLGPDARRMAI